MMKTRGAKLTTNAKDLKTERILIYLTEAERALIQKHAKMESRSLSSYILKAALDNAKHMEESEYES